ncbi:hypothetical protein BZA70DRAFT_269055 [Myxozyma melibiosi]|uniref:DH domain-containing protein n=1 Tax=Myxozyma melibiosi TaxID=54550 RepID=A0ABR1F1C0_9ASCO
MSASSVPVVVPQRSSPTSAASSSLSSSSFSSPDSASASRVNASTPATSVDSEDVNGLSLKYADESTLLPTEHDEQDECNVDDAATSVSNLTLIRRVNSYTGSSQPSLGGTTTGRFRYEPSAMPSSALRALRRRMCIEEFISTEENYLSGLRILVNNYFSTLDACGPCMAFIAADIKESGAALLEFHQEVLNVLYRTYPALYAPSSNERSGYLPLDLSLRDSQRGFSGFESEVFTALDDQKAGSSAGRRVPSWSQCEESISSPAVAGSVAELVMKKAADLALYEQYSLNYSNVIDILEMSTDQYSKIWNDGSRQFLMASNAISQRADVSIESLALSPIHRTMRYLLLLQELARHTQPEDSIEASATIAAAVKSVKGYVEKLDSAQAVTSTNNTLANSSELWRRLRFEKPAPAASFDGKDDEEGGGGADRGMYAPEFLGKAILCGALHVGWIAVDGSFRSQYYGVFLFKSCVVVCSVEKVNRYTVKFLIPLCCARVLSCDPVDGEKGEKEEGEEVGMQSSYHTSFKLLFEHDFRVFELLVTPMSIAEKNVWVEYLQSQICVNGGGAEYDWKAFKTSEHAMEGSGQVTVLPSLIRPLWISQPREDGKRAVEEAGGAARINISHFLVPERVDEEHHQQESGNVQPKRGRSSRVSSPLVYFAEYNDKLLSPKSPTTMSPTMVSISSRGGETTEQDGEDDDDQTMAQFAVTVKLSDRIQTEKMIALVWSREELALAQDVCVVKHHGLGSGRVMCLVRRISGVGSSFAAGFSKRSSSSSSLGSISGFDEVDGGKRSSEDENGLSPASSSMSSGSPRGVAYRRVPRPKQSGDVVMNPKSRGRERQLRGVSVGTGEVVRRISGRLSGVRNVSASLLKVRY